MKPVVVALLPEHGEIPEVESTLNAKPNEAGRFVLQAVPPGSYRVFTLDASNWALLMRPDILMEKHRAAATLISVAEGESKAFVVSPSKIPLE